MSAEVPTPPSARAITRAPFLNSNRKQVILFAVLTLLLTVATVWGGRIWLRNSETLTFAVGETNGLEARFAAKLAAMLKATASRLEIKIIRNADNARALAQFDRKLADLAVLRTDAKIPPRARSIAILEHDVLMLISPGDKKIKSLAELKKKKVAVLASGNNLTFVRNVLDIAEGADAASRLQLAAPHTTLDTLFTSGSYGAVIVVDHASALVKDKNFEQISKRTPFTVNAIDEAKALSRRHSGILEETLATGLL